MIPSVVEAFRWCESKEVLEVLDQLALPSTVRFVPLSTASEAAEAIRSMLVRGAPAIGIVAAYGLYFSAKHFWLEDDKLSRIAA
ncbi:MAG: S-methyl-5-thioribose-1-phosphate isomerase, partial [Proteobacteria bacterium]|nr:S-methyl-5-thioribose-1-phosphate isomerase [Pseudomonadota bacterium]